MRDGSNLDGLKQINAPHCPCCESAKIYVWWKNSKYKSPKNAEHFMYGGSKFISQLKKCLQCGFIFQDPIVDSQTFYEEINPHIYLKMNKFRKKYFEKLKKKIENHLNINEASSLLDLGAGSGEWLDCFSGDMKFASEININLIEILGKKKIKVIENLKDTKLQSFSGTLYISAFDYLEHVVDIREFLSQIQKIFLGDTYLVIGVPDMGKLLSRILRRRYYLYTPMHYSYFTKKSLNSLVSQYVENPRFFKSPGMTTDLSGIGKWFRVRIPDPLGSLTMPIPYRASLIVVGRVKNAR